jgi:hypothetical protein
VSVVGVTVVGDVTLLESDPHAAKHSIDITIARSRARRRTSIRSFMKNSSL